MPRAAGTPRTSPSCVAIGAFPQVRPFRAVVLYGLAAHLRTLAGREGDAARRRELERRERAILVAAREALRVTLDGGRG